MTRPDNVLREREKSPAPAAGLDEPGMRNLRRELARNAVAMARRGETAVAPGVLDEDIAFYLDPQRFAREHQALFRDMPLVACLSSDMPDPGSFRTFDDTGVPILLTRGKDGRLRAFLNVCPHRSARVVRSECGKASRFTCRFHGWTFDSAGKAIGIPEEERFGAAIADRKRLIECPAEERHGLIFVQATPGSTMDLDAHLGELDCDLAVLGLAEAVRVHSDDLPVAANWKYGLDTFFETYHLNSLHRETFKGLFSPVCVFDTFGPHHRYTFAPSIVDQWTTMPEAEWQVDLLPLQYFLFPNTIISVGSTSPSGSTVNIHRIFPQAVDHFVSKMAYCAMGGVKSPENGAEIERAYATARAALLNEDYSVAAESRIGMAALPSGTKLPIGPHEIGVQNFHRNVRRFAGV